MKHIKLFEQYLTEERETQKKAALDFVEKKGKATWKEIHSFLMKNKGYDPGDPENRGNISSYFSDKLSKSRRNVLMIPTKKDPRYLEKDGKVYVVKVWDGESNIA